MRLAAAAVAAAALVGCSATPAPQSERGCGRAPDPSSEFMCFSELLDEFHTEAATLVIPDGRALVEPAPFPDVYNAAGELETHAFERGYGRGDATTGWLCLWMGQWLHLNANGEDPLPALQQLETVVDTYWFKNDADPASLQPHLLNMFTRASLGDGTDLHRYWALNCGLYHEQYPELPTTVE
ncbi:hypothetical protein [Salinibacterium sp. ZJ77]|nr:hypothetical protein [Salinibacterium sp. ZJ77]